MFVVTKYCYLKKVFCRDKNTFIATKDVFCRDKHVFIATELLSQQIFDLWQLPPMIADHLRRTA